MSEHNLLEEFGNLFTNCLVLQEFVKYKKTIEFETKNDLFSIFMSYCYDKRIKNLNQRLCLLVRITKQFIKNNNEFDIQPNIILVSFIRNIPNKSNWMYQYIIEDMLSMNENKFEGKYENNKDISNKILYETIENICSVLEDDF